MRRVARVEHVSVLQRHHGGQHAVVGLNGSFAIGRSKTRDDNSSEELGSLGAIASPRSLSKWHTATVMFVFEPRSHDAVSWIHPTLVDALAQRDTDAGSLNLQVIFNTTTVVAFVALLRTGPTARGREVARFVWISTPVATRGLDIRRSGTHVTTRHDQTVTLPTRVTMLVCDPA